MVIYEPKGKAREYSPLAVNFYKGCDHKCVYCYAPAIMRKTREDYSKNVNERNNIVAQFKKDAERLAYSDKQILFNFMGDPYCHADVEYRTTRECLKISLENRLPIAILTKGGFRALRDIDIIKKFGSHIKVGATLTFFDEQKSLDWESGASTPNERLTMLKTFHDEGVKTWASFEPVIEPEESLKLIRASLDVVDEYKIGKLNNYKGLDKTIDWTTFLIEVVDILRKANKPFYIKEDLRKECANC